MNLIKLVLKGESGSPNLSKSELRRLRDKKIVKYQWIPEILSRMLLSRLPRNTDIEFDDLYAAGITELTKQMERIYSDPKLVNRLWSDKKKDLIVGPFFLKGLKDPYIKNSDSGSLKFVKGAILDEMRSQILLLLVKDRNSKILINSVEIMLIL